MAFSSYQFVNYSTNATVIVDMEIPNFTSNSTVIDSYLLPEDDPHYNLSIDLYPKGRSRREQNQIEIVLINLDRRDHPPLMIQLIVFILDVNGERQEPLGKRRLLFDFNRF